MAQIITAAGSLETCNPAWTSGYSPRAIFPPQISPSEQFAPGHLVQTFHRRHSSPDTSTPTHPRTFVLGIFPGYSPFIDIIIIEGIYKAQDCLKATSARYASSGSVYCLHTLSKQLNRNIFSCVQFSPKHSSFPDNSLAIPPSTLRPCLLSVSTPWAACLLHRALLLSRPSSSAKKINAITFFQK